MTIDNVRVFVQGLTQEIYRRRKENHEKRKASKWNPDNILKVEQRMLLDWIEEELAKFNQLLAASGPASRTSAATDDLEKATAAAILGRHGGSAQTKRKAVAARANGKLGGRPRKSEETQADRSVS